MARASIKSPSGLLLFALFVAQLLLFVRGTMALDTTFLYPAAPNMAYYNGETINVTYISSIAQATLHTWCRDPNKNSENILIDSRSAKPDNGSTLFPVNVNTTYSSCWFQLVGLLSSKQANSVGFVLSDRNMASTTFGLTGSPTTSFATSSTPTIASVSATNTSGSGGSGGGSSGLSAGAKAGIAIGVVLGVLAVAVAGWFFLRRRKSKKGPSELHGESAAAPAYVDKDRYGGQTPSTQATEPATELSAEPRATELPVAEEPPAELPG